jgi:succinate dehydrogenase/fumarate reductase iron-sulfur protein
MADSITAKILRYDPSVDAAPEYKSYTVEWVESEGGLMTGLQVLHIINETEEQIGYDFCCRSSLCGRCGMLIDGKPCLACWTALEPGEHVFEPLSGFPVIKDLVVDKDRAYERFIGANIAIQTVNPMTMLKNIDYDLYWNTLEKLNMCRECMCCYVACPKLQNEGKWDKFIGPGATMGIAQRYFDTEDESDRLQQAVFSGLFVCDACGECSKVCPARIPIADLIKQMQTDAEARGLKPEVVG